MGAGVSWWDFIQYSFRRSNTIGVGYYDQGHIVEIKDAASYGRSHPRAGSEPRVTRFFSLGPKQEIDETDKALLDDAYWASIKLSRDVAALKAQPTVQACVVRAGELHLNDETIEQATRLIDQAIEIRRKQINGSSYELARKAAASFSDADVIAAKNFGEILADVQRPTERGQALDLIMIFHGSDQGLLFDASGLIVPRSKWNELAEQKINSVTIYSCFPEQVVRFYSAAFDRLASKGIRIYFPVNLTGWADNQTTPLLSLDVFSEKLLGIFSETSRK
jgi:hypothetical protein